MSEQTEQKGEFDVYPSVSGCLAGPAADPALFSAYTATQLSGGQRVDWDAGVYQARELSAGGGFQSARWHQSYLAVKRGRTSAGRGCGLNRQSWAIRSIRSTLV